MNSRTCFTDYHARIVKHIRIALDSVMMILSLVLMGGNQLFTADIVHEICGTGMFALWIVHVALNRRWYASLWKRMKAVPQSKFNALRFMQTVINVGILVCAVLLMASGIIISNHVFVFLHISGGASFGRTVHLVVSHWYFMFMSLHVGLHAGAMIRTAILRMAAACASVYGCYAFIVRGIWKYLLYRQPFFFLDMSHGYVLFFTDYACMMILIASVSHLHDFRKQLFG